MRFDFSRGQFILDTQRNKALSLKEMCDLLNMLHDKLTEEIFTNFSRASRSVCREDVDVDRWINEELDK